MVQLASDRNFFVKTFDGITSFVKALFTTIFIYLITLFNIGKPSKEVNKDDIQYLKDKYLPKFGKQKKQKGDDDQQDQNRPKVVRGLGGSSNCNT